MATSTYAIQRYGPRATAHLSALRPTVPPCAPLHHAVLLAPLLAVPLAAGAGAAGALEVVLEAGTGEEAVVEVEAADEEEGNGAAAGAALGSTSVGK